VKLHFIAFVLSATIGSAQTPATRPEFEVASIKPHPGDYRAIALGEPSPGRFHAIGATLKNLMTVAYEVQDYQITGGPNWISSERYDIEAKTEVSSALKVTECLQSLLEDRFKLKVHRDTKEMPIYVLMVAKGGPKLKESEGECPSPPGPRSPCGGLTGIWNRMSGTSVPMERLVDGLSWDLGRSIIDKTGLAGRYDVHLEWTPDQSQTWVLPFAPPPQSDNSGPSIYTALQEQLGLRLESAKGPAKILVIDHAERPSDN
jgi:uncharacterized protein (TIGR03435 family)